MTRHTIALVALSSLLAGCGDSAPDTAALPGSLPQAQAASAGIDTGVAEDFFGDLPRAADAREAEMGDLYFKLLTRLTSKLDAVTDEGDLVNARAYLQYVRMEAATMVERSQSVAIEERKALFQDSVATVNYARMQYSRALKKLERKHPNLAEELGELASASWPLLASNR